MLVLSRKHPFPELHDISNTGNALTKSMQNIADKVKSQNGTNTEDEEIAIVDSHPMNNKLLTRYPSGIPYNYVNEVEDCSLILELFDPVLNDKRRETKERLSRLIQNDAIGFRPIQQQLKSFESICTLRIGRRNGHTTLKNIKNLEKIQAQIILHTYHLLQRPRKKPLQEFYKDQEEAELEGMSCHLKNISRVPNFLLVFQHFNYIPFLAMSKAIEPSIRPEGPFISIQRGEVTPEFQANTPRSIDAILEHYSSTQNKTHCGAVLDQNGKIGASLTYGEFIILIC
jgi:hypothetical protein